MTCIATDGKTMAADSRSCVGDLITTDSADKLVKGTDGAVLGCAGDRASCILVREWFEKGADLATIPKLPAAAEDGGPFDALILRPDGSVEGLDRLFTFMPRSAPAAIGTGGQIALGAMLAGKSPVQAVRLASEHVTSVGGHVHEIEPTKAAE
jgi:hypothetical protein